MNYTTFLELLQQEVKQQLGTEAIIRINRMLKNNNTCKDSMTILYVGENISPAIYLDYFYEQYRKNVSIEEIARQVLECYHQHKKDGRLNPDFYLNFSGIHDKIFCKLINLEKNRELLEQIPYKRFLDLAVVYYCEVEDDTFGTGTILIQNPHLQIWKIHAEMLHELAVRNTLQSVPYEFSEVSEMVKKMTGMELEPIAEGDTPMYVLSNVKKFFGAVSLYFPEVLESIGEKLQTDFYILPSSIHECMVIPIKDGTCMKGTDYQEMVEEINEHFVEREEILSDSVYRFYRGRRELCIAAQAKS